MKQTSIWLMAIIITTLMSCEKIVGDGPVVTETRIHTNFSGIDLRISGDVYYTQAPEFSVEVSGQQNVLNVLETYTSNNRLVIKYENDVRVRSHERVRIVISAPLVNTLRVSGSGNIHTNGMMNPGYMDMDVSGSGDILIAELYTGPIDANISGSGSITVNTGLATKEELKISGSGDIDLRNVVAKEASTVTSGSGSIQVNLSERLNSIISGSGSVYYRGDPVVSSKISGSGRVIKL